jgi:hypothetical protein
MKEITIPEGKNITNLLDVIMGSVSPDQLMEIRELISQRLGDAPKDGVQYARIDGAWVPVRTTRSYFRGEYESVELAEQSISDPQAGDYCLCGELGDRHYYNWHPVRSIWIEGGSLALDPDVIKNLYESGDDTKLSQLLYAPKMFDPAAPPVYWAGDISVYGDSYYYNETNRKISLPIRIPLSRYDYSGTIPFRDPQGHLTDINAFLENTDPGTVTDQTLVTRGYVKGMIDDIPSVDVSGKRDTETRAWVLYATGQNGTQTAIAYSGNAGTINTIPVRNGDGNIYVGATPTQPTQAASKQYVDSKIGSPILTWSYTDTTRTIASGTSAAMTHYKTAAQILSVYNTYFIDGVQYIHSISMTGLLGLSESRVYFTMTTNDILLHNDSGDDITNWKCVILYR